MLQLLQMLLRYKDLSKKRRMFSLGNYLYNIYIYYINNFVQKINADNQRFISKKGGINCAKIAHPM